jgi:hypothetical protein
MIRWEKLIKIGRGYTLDGLRKNGTPKETCKEHPSCKLDRDSNSSWNHNALSLLVLYNRCTNSSTLMINTSKEKGNLKWISALIVLYKQSEYELRYELW